MSANGEKRRLLAAVTLQRVMRGWKARRLVEQTMDWSSVREARSQAGDVSRRQRNENGMQAAGGWEESAGPISDGSVVMSRGLGRATPLHSTGVGEESLEGLLQDLGL